MNPLALLTQAACSTPSEEAPIEIPEELSERITRVIDLYESPFTDAEGNLDLNKGEGEYSRMKTNCQQGYLRFTLINPKDPNDPNTKYQDSEVLLHKADNPVPENLKSIRARAAETSQPPVRLYDLALHEGAKRYFDKECSKPEENPQSPSSSIMFTVHPEGQVIVENND